MTKTPKPIMHGRDHEYGGADEVLIAWEDCADDTGGGSGGGVNDGVVAASWNTGTSFGGPAPVAGTFSDGTSPGWWNTGTGGSTMATTLTSGSWTVHVAGTVTHAGPTVPVVVYFAQGSGTGEVGVEIFNVSMADTDTQPLSYTTTIDLADGLTVSLPVIHAHAGAVGSSTFDGTITFTAAP